MVRALKTVLRICPQCNVEKPAYMFYRNTITKTLDKICKKCKTKNATDAYRARTGLS